MNSQKELQHYDKGGANRAKENLKHFLEHLNEWLLTAQEQGLKIETINQLFTYLADSEQIKKHFKELAIEDSKNFRLQSAINQLFEQADETAKKLQQGLNACIKLNYATDKAPQFWDTAIISKLKDYFALKDNEVFLKSGTYAKIDELYTFTPDETGKKIYNELAKALFYIEQYNQMVDKLNISEQKIQLENNALLFSQDLKINEKEICQRSWNAITQPNKRRKAKVNESTERTREPYTTGK